jgi:large subunit ribosomal protein L21
MGRAKVNVKASRVLPKAQKVLIWTLMEFAVIKTGGKQYIVREGETIRIEKLAGKHHLGDKVTFEEVLLKGTEKALNIGAPTVSGSTVSATITAIDKAKTIRVVKYKAKSNYLKQRGHRQPFCEVKIDSIK